MRLCPVQRTRSFPKRFLHFNGTREKFENFSRHLGRLPLYRTISAGSFLSFAIQRDRRRANRSRYGRLLAKSYRTVLSQSKRRTSRNSFKFRWITKLVIKNGRNFLSQIIKCFCSIGTALPCRRMDRRHLCHISQSTNSALEI